MMLYKLLSHMNRERFDAQVISFIGGHDLVTKIENLGIAVYSLGMTRSYTNLTGIARLVQHLRQHPPSLIQTWMYHADFAGGITGKLFTGAPVVWNLQASDFADNADNRMTPLTIKVCAFLSSFIPQKIISCSEVGCRVHARLGYDVSKLLPIPNGVELARFRPDDAARVTLRRELRLAEETPLIGLVARFHPQKDHRNFLQAAARLKLERPDVHFVLCGDGVTWENAELAAWVAETDLKENIHLLGRRSDTPQVNAALDIATLSSAYAEGFPNVLGEAMACEVPCVVTDIGDSSLIVGETGITVPPRDSEALANAWLSLLQLPAAQRRTLGQLARRRVEEKFSLRSIVERYEKLYADLLYAA